jgi:hypothetical protein
MPMVGGSEGYAGGATWSLADIPYQALEHDRVRGDTQLFYTVATASFVEITSDLYTRNLVAFFAGDPEIVDWLQRGWEREELQHGAALRRYVETAWPDFDWESAYRRFMDEFTQFCSVDQLAPTRALEMAARCVVETGTAAFYRMLSEMSPEPVLRAVTANIQADEVRHYKYFYRHFLRYQALERPGRGAVMRTLWNRVGEVDAEDAFYAFKHVYLASNPGAAFARGDYEQFRATFRRLAKRHFPYGMAVKMLLKPLGMSAAVGRVVLPAATAATRFLLLR